MPTMYVYTTEELGTANNKVAFTCYPAQALDALPDVESVSNNNTGYDISTLHVTEIEVDNDIVANGAIHMVDFNETNDGFIVTKG